MLQVTLGNFTLTNCLMNAAGCLCSREQQLINLSTSNLGAIVSKTSTLASREGNVYPRVFFSSVGSINSAGSPNKGFDFYDQFDIFDKPFIQSIMPFNIGEFHTMLKKMDPSRLYELNLSCPNIEGKPVVSYDFEEFEHYLKVLDGYDCQIGLKLPPYFHNYQFDLVAELIIRYQRNIKYVASINTIGGGLLVDYLTNSTVIRANNGYGGIGGSYCKPVGLANVHNLYLRLPESVKIIGCGGVTNGVDVYDYILCGATAVQVGTQLIQEGPDIFERLTEELIEIMTGKGYSGLSNFRGLLQLRSKL